MRRRCPFRPFQRLLYRARIYFCKFPDKWRGNPEVMCTFLASDCVQVVYMKAGLKGRKMDLSNAESTTDSWATGPNIAGGTFTTISLYGGLAYFANVRNLRFGTRQQLFRSTYCARSPIHGSFHRGIYSPRSVKMYWLSWKVQCFDLVPINRQNHNAGRSKIYC